MGDQKTHVFVANFHWSGAVHTCHGGHREKKKNNIGTNWAIKTYKKHTNIVQKLQRSCTATAPQTRQKLKTQRPKPRVSARLSSVQYASPCRRRLLKVLRSQTPAKSVYSRKKKRKKKTPKNKKNKESWQFRGKTADPFGPITLPHLDRL